MGPTASTGFEPANLRTRGQRMWEISACVFITVLADWNRSNHSDTPFAVRFFYRCPKHCSFQWYVPEDGGFLRDKASVVGEMIKEREKFFEYWSHYERTEMSFRNMEVCWNVKWAEPVAGCCDLFVQAVEEPWHGYLHSRLSTRGLWILTHG
jgi:hypothetical protein